MRNVVSSIAHPDAPDPDPLLPVVVEAVSARLPRMTITSFVRGELPAFARRRGLGPYLRAIVRRG